MKFKFLFFLSLICLAVTFAISVEASTSNQNYFLHCLKKGAGGVAEVFIFDDTNPFRALVTVGGASERHEANFSNLVEKESDDLGTQIFETVDFSLTVEVRQAVASLSSTVDGQPISIQKMHCDFNEFHPHPGVTMGN